jgi:hypothetical protein
VAKKKRSDALDEAEKLLPVDALGTVMLTHGEQFGDDRAFGAYLSSPRISRLRAFGWLWYKGSSLARLGRAHCKVATLQDAYALTFHDTFLRSMQSFADEIGEYDHLKKKLESRR